MDDIRFAHKDQTDVCFDEDGKYFITGGIDGEILIWNNFDDDDPVSHCLENGISSFALKEDVLYVANNEFTVSAYSVPSIEFEQIIAQFSSAVYHVVCSKNGKFVAAGGGDFLIKVFNLESHQLMELRGHKGPILSLSFDPQGLLLASSGCDGFVKVWDLKTQQCIKSLNLLKKTNDFCKTAPYYRLDWNHDGEYLAIPVEKEIKVFERKTWEQKFILTDECLEKDISLVKYSPYGQYICASTICGQMLVWDVEKCKCISKCFCDKDYLFSGLKWNPNGGDLVFCDIKGRVGLYSNPLHSVEEETANVETKKNLNVITKVDDNDEPKTKNKKIEFFPDCGAIDHSNADDPKMKNKNIESVLDHEAVDDSNADEPKMKNKNIESFLDHKTIDNSDADEPKAKNKKIESFLNHEAMDDSDADELKMDSNNFESFEEIDDEPKVKNKNIESFLDNKVTDDSDADELKTKNENIESFLDHEAIDDSDADESEMDCNSLESFLDNEEIDDADGKEEAVDKEDADSKKCAANGKKDANSKKGAANGKKDANSKKGAANGEKHANSKKSAANGKKDANSKKGAANGEKDANSKKGNADGDAEADSDNDSDLEADSLDDNEDECDIGAIKASLEPKIFGSNKEEETADINSKDTAVDEEKVELIEAPKPPIQTTFQPSSTPISYDQRFMLWNNIGVVRCYNTTEENTIDVEFHDSNVCHPLHMLNEMNHTLAALSTEALLLACPNYSDKPSTLECLHFSSIDSKKEWFLKMSKDEEIEAITLGDGFAACITSKKYVRILSVGGVQSEIFSIPGSVVCCSGKGNQLLIVYHKAYGIENDQCFNLMIVQVKIGGHSCIKECSVPLSHEAYLTWLGFSDEGSPCVVDTSGIISLLNISCGMKWIPIADTRLKDKTKSNSYFVIGLSEIKQEIRCILCKGSRFPPLLPKPTIAVVNFSLPFCEITTNKGVLEEENRRHFLTLTCLENLIKEGYELDSELRSTEKHLMDVLLKMFALATKSEKESRAIEVAEMMPKPIIVEGAIRYATQSRRMALAERLGEIMNKKLYPQVDIEGDISLSDDEILSQPIIAKNTVLSNSNVKEKEVLKPKPLMMRKSQIDNYMEETDSCLETDAHDLSSSNINDVQATKSLSTTNPFKASSKLQNKKEEILNHSGIDDILSNSMKNTSKGQDSTEKQKVSIFLGMKKRVDKSSSTGKTGFNLFLEENRDQIQSTMNDGAEEKDLVNTAMKLYKELSKSEKQKYMKNNSLKENNVGNTNNVVLNGNSGEVLESTVTSLKRKETKTELDEDIIPKPKKIKQDKLPDATVRKLTQFAFVKSSK